MRQHAGSAVGGTMPGPCRYCGAATWTADDAGPAHACCTAWRAVIAAGYPCPSCEAGRWLASPHTRGRTMPRLPRRLPDGRPFAPDLQTSRPPRELAMTTDTTARRPAADPRAAAAAAYIGRGWPVFVLGRTRRPAANCPACRDPGPGHDRAGCGCLTCHGFYAATLDPARLAAMLAAVPAGVLAIRTGAASGLLVVDLDPRNGGRLDRDLMNPTATVATGGGGWHLYYRHPGGPAAAALPDRAGVDIKADGGYVVAPPSIHPGTGRPYQWAGARAVSEMAPALAAAVTPPVAAAPPCPPAGLRPAGAISSPAALLAAHLAAVEAAPEGRRRVTLYGAARGVWRMIAAGVITDADARAALTAAGHAASQAPAQIRAAINGGFTDEAAA
jgi:hypothetical protein